MILKKLVDWSLDLSWQVHALIAGYPCCSISHQNVHQKSFLDKKSKTGSGYHSMISYVKKNPSVIVIVLENVKGMMHTHERNLGMRNLWKYKLLPWPSWAFAVFSAACLVAQSLALPSDA